MTVGELRVKLEGLDPKTPVSVIRETDAGMELLEVSDATVHAGTPHRHPDTRRAGFSFDGFGPARWLFISTEES